MKAAPRSGTGFTLIELTLVVAVIGILAGIAIPAYRDYTIRAKVVEAFSLAAPAQKAVAEYYDRWGRFPKDNASAGLYSPEAWAAGAVKAVHIVDGAVHVEVDMRNIPAFVLFLRPTVSVAAPTTSLAWVCNNGRPAPGRETVGPIDISRVADARYLPAVCR